MATVLRKMATTLIRLREKLELQTFRVAGIWILSKQTFEAFVVKHYHFFFFLTLRF